MKPVWCVLANDSNWCAIKDGHKPDIDDIRDETECNRFVILRQSASETLPTCPECFKKLEKK